MLGDLAVLTPPLVVCAALLFAIGAFLRHEMGARRRTADDASSADISADDQIPDPGIGDAAVLPDAGTANDGTGKTEHRGCRPGQ